MLDSILPFPNRTALSNTLARKYMPRIEVHAARYARRAAGRLSFSDLVGAGAEGLVSAFGRFDQSRPEKLDAFLDHRIRGAILDELRENDPLTRDQRAFARQVSTTVRSLTRTLGRAPDVTETAKALGKTVAELQAGMARIHDANSQHGAAAYDDETCAMRRSISPPPDEAAEILEAIARVRSAMDELPERHREILRLHYEVGQNFREISESLGVTESRVSQIHSDAIARLRKRLSVKLGLTRS